MEPLYTGALIVDHKFHPSTQRFAVETPYDARIEVLKQKAQEKRPELSSFILSDLGVWRMKGDMVIKKLKLSELLGKIDINDENTIEALDDEEKVANMGLSFGETLLLQTPGTSCVSIIVCRVLIQVSRQRRHHEGCGPRI